MKWGVIATGGIAHAVTADMLKAGATVLAVSSRDITKAQKFAENFGIERAYGDYRDLLADPDVEVVYVATPHGQHHEVVLAALDAGKNVLCEKAFALTVADAEEMIERARSKNLFLMEAMWTRFNPLVRKVQEAIEAGEIGEVRMIRADFGFRHAFSDGDRLWAKEAGGGATLDLGVYPVALTHQLLGVPTHVHAHGSLAPTEVDADAGIFLAYDNGAHALLSCSLVADTGARAEIVGTLGRIELVDPMFNPTAVVINGVEHTIEDEGYQHQIRAVEESVAAGLTENPRITWENTLEVMRTLEEALRQMGVSYAGAK
ncbi:Gfo/Idh/MocA family oxidoreductase [Lentzea sp. BCCO 10_0061]|uniref:Gfo/Idh/MocA family oxidoreductase n=1 Tax=Lentzea sokolovensis TaxID=3095429 RepID=A0ABU4UXX9_9PSEU|nr:Gfo/Idh/MocA family oxidoreductase [Lentzea sp. BCCO 10_0061]MDX8143540.1 Gfo/Idh/MocA family oxidoreductase [Lentzea sp. BCCO 10_0061]